MARLRYNGLTATLGADLLTADTTITFAAALTSAAGAVPTISGSDYIPLAVLDTDGSVLEIIHLTAYTTGATTGTVTRAQESTTAADRASGLTVVNGPTAADFPSSTIPSVMLKRTAVLSLTNDTVTPVPWTAEDWDTHAFHDNATNNTRITIPTGMGGLYLLSGTAQHEATTGMIQCRFHKNGTLIANGISAYASTSGWPTVSHSTVVRLVPGDYVELAAYQSSGAAANLNHAASSFGATFLGL